MRRGYLVTRSIALLFGIASGTVAEAKGVLITSDPSGAQVLVDGRPMGRTPLQTTKQRLMPPGYTFDGLHSKATITIELPMYETISIVLSEYAVEPVHHFTLHKKPGAELVENYLAEVEGLAASTLQSTHHALHLTSDMDSESASLFSGGYVLVGYLGYTAEIVPIDQIRARAQQSGAAVVLVQSKVAGAETDFREVTSNASASIGVRTSVSSSASLAGGNFQAQSVSQPGAGVAGSWSGWASGSGSSTAFNFVPGRATTEFIPFSRRQYDTQVTLWRKRAPNAIGAHCETLPQQLRKQLQRNTGGLVVAVEDNSPAFFANILVGDVLTAIGGRPVGMAADIPLLASAFRGQVVDVEIIRPSGVTTVRVEIK